MVLVVEEEEEEENLRALAMRVGSDIVVMKPITCEAIVQKVEDICSYQKSRHFWKVKDPNFSTDTSSNNIRIRLLTNH
jgi:hypothetical protein